MRKSSRTYAIGVFALLGRVAYIFVQEKGFPSGINFSVQSFVQGEADVFVTDPIQEHQRGIDEKIEDQRETIQKEQSDLVKAASQLADNEYTTTSLQVDQGTYDIQLLLQLYENTPSDSLAGLLLQYYRQEMWYDEAQNIIEKHPSLLPSQITRQEALQIYVNTSQIVISQPKSILKLQKKLGQWHTERKIGIQDKIRYESLIQLWNGDVDGFLNGITTVNDPFYASAKQAMIQNQSYVAGQKEVPGYYLQALLGLSLLQHQYLPFAEKVALDVVIKDANYILPYQILAYTTFLQRDWTQSTYYIRELLARDGQQRPMYQFMLGVMSYRQENYQEAVLYFIGVDNKALNADKLRYLSLSYLALGDMTQSVLIFEKLVDEQDLLPSDYYNYFYHTYFRPYRTNTSYALLEENRTVALRYHESCTLTLKGQWEHVCSYGEVGQLLLSKQYDQAFKRLLYLTKYYPQSYFFEALGDYYQRQGKTQDAIMYYLQAIRYTKDTVEFIDARRKIEELLSG